MNEGRRSEDDRMKDLSEAVFQLVADKQDNYKAIALQGIIVIIAVIGFFGGAIKLYFEPYFQNIDQRLTKIEVGQGHTAKEVSTNSQSLARQEAKMEALERTVYTSK